MTKQDRDEILKLINEIISDIENNRIFLSKALTRAQRVYGKTGDEELKEFVTREIEGNFNDDSLPEYRKRYAEPMGVFRHRVTGFEQHVMLQYGPLLKKTNINPNAIYERPVTFSVSAIESYLEKKNTGDLMIEYTSGQLSFIKKYLSVEEDNDWYLQTAYFKFPGNTLDQILSIIQSRFIDILLRIENEFKRSVQLDNENFFEDGKHFDALVKLSEPLINANKEIILIDNFIDAKTLQFLSAKKPNVHVKILTDKKSNNASLQIYIDSFNAQYKNLLIKSSSAFHDRFLIIDGKYFYHIGASIKDAGKKIFMFSIIEEVEIQKTVLKKFNAEWKE